MIDILNDKKSLLFLLLICFATVFMSIGYAKIESITSEITGTVIADAQEGIIITDVTVFGATNADKDDSIINSFFQTVLSTKAVLSNEYADSSVTYLITIYNNNSSDYKFSGITYDESFYDNEGIVYTLSGIKENDVLKSGQEISFYITFSYLDNVIADSNILNCYLNFAFNENVTNVASYSEITKLLGAVSSDETLNLSVSQNIENVTSTINISTGNVTLDLNGYTFKTESLSSSSSLINISGDANVVIKNSGSNGEYYSNMMGVYLSSNFTGTVELDGLVINTKDDCAVRNASTNGGVLIIKNCEITSTNWAGVNNIATGTVKVYDSIITGNNFALKNDGGGILEVYSGTFTGGSKAVLNSDGTMVITGGSFNDDSFKSYVQSGYTYSKDTNNYYVVTEENSN